MGDRRVRDADAGGIGDVEGVSNVTNNPCVKCHPERTREGSGAERLGQILREYAQDDTFLAVILGSGAILPGDSDR